MKRIEETYDRKAILAEKYSKNTKQRKWKDYTYDTESEEPVKAKPGRRPFNSNIKEN